ncbi:TPA: hypothetical protein QEM96_003373 [Pseudomonas putida]|nr:hypothetical protein [Pseudomonas putida]
MQEFYKLFFEVLAYAGGSATLAYTIFKWLGSKWIENKFAIRLDQMRHQQSLELQRLRVEIDAMLSGALKIQEREFSILPETWSLANEAYEVVSWLSQPLQTYADVDRMQPNELEEYLSSTTFRESEKENIRNAHNKNTKLQEISFWHRLFKAKQEFSKLQNYMARNGIFLPIELDKKLNQFTDILWSAICSKEIGREANDLVMENSARREMTEKAKPLHAEIKTDIQARLQSHSLKQSR